MRRMTQPLPPLTKDLLEAFAASAVAWLVRLLGIVLTPGAARRRRLLRGFLNHIERCVECIVLLEAVRQLPPPPRQSARPRSTPPGFRRSRRNIRQLWKCAHIRARHAGPIARITRLLDVLARPEPYVARFIQRLGKGVAFSRLVLAAPPAAAFTSAAPRAIAFADSS
jgi:hypothetical protein